MLGPGETRFRLPAASIAIANPAVTSVAVVSTAAVGSGSGAAPADAAAGGGGGGGVAVSAAPKRISDRVSPSAATEPLNTVAVVDLAAQHAAHHQAVMSSSASSSSSSSSSSASSVASGSGGGGSGGGGGASSIPAMAMAILPGVPVVDSGTANHMSVHVHVDRDDVSNREVDINCGAQNNDLQSDVEAPHARATPLTLKISAD